MGMCKRRCPSGVNFGFSFFLVYINDLVDVLSLNAKLFADDTSLFLLVHDVDIFANKLNDRICMCFPTETEL